MPHAANTPTSTVAGKSVPNTGTESEPHSTPPPERCTHCCWLTVVLPPVLVLACVGLQQAAS